MNAAPFTGGRTLMIRAAAVGGIGLAATAAGGAFDARRALFAYLAAFVYWVGIALAALVFLLANEAAGSRWYIVVRRVLESLPTALTVAGCLVMAAAATALGDPAKGEVAGTFQRFLVVFVALASMPPTILQRLWVRVANEGRRALGLPPGEDPTAGHGLMGIWWHEGLKALRQVGATAASLVPFLVVLHVLPFRRTTRAIALALWGFYWLIVDAFELPMEVVPGPRRGGSAPWFARLLIAAPSLHRTLRPVAPAGRGLARLSAPWHEELRFTERHPWETLGFGLVMGTLLAVPVVGLFFRAVGITAATALLGRLDGTDQP